MTAVFIWQSYTGPVLFVSWDRVLRYRSVLSSKATFSSLFLEFLWEILPLLAEDCVTQGPGGRDVVFLHLRCDARSGFVGFPRMRVVLWPLCHQWGRSPLAASPSA